MSSITYRFAKFVLLTALFISIPASLIYYDYVNDPITQNNGEVTNFSMTFNSSKVYEEIIVEDLPSLSVLRTYINFTNSDFNGDIDLLIIESSRYRTFKQGLYPINELPGVTITDEFQPHWYNVTTLSEGFVRLVGISNIPLNSSVTIEGKYLYETENYLVRNIFEIVAYTALYTILAIGMIPYAIKRFRINSMKRRKARELIEEEEEFYRKLQDQ